MSPTAAPTRDSARVRGVFTLRKYADDAAYAAGQAYEQTSFENAFTTAGLQAMGRLLTGQGAVTHFGEANAHLGVGDSSAAFSAAHTDLQAASNKLRKAMSSGYPLDPTNGVWTWRAVFGSSEANFAWAEMAVFNASSSGIMLCRVVSAQGTKTSGQTWTLTYTMTVA